MTDKTKTIDITPARYRELIKMMYDDAPITAICADLGIGRPAHYEFLERGVLRSSIAERIETKAAQKTAQLTLRAKRLTQIIKDMNTA